MNDRHVRIEANGELVCDHCHERYRMAVPESLALLVEIMRAWLRLHADCPKGEQ